MTQESQSSLRRAFRRRAHTISPTQGYLPRVIFIHIGNPHEQETKEEVARVAQELEADIILGYEDMKITL